MELVAPHDSASLGAHLSPDGCTFRLWAPRAQRVELALVAADLQQHNVEMEQSPDGVWTSFVPGVVAEQRYGFRVHGPWDPDRGMRFNPAKLLLDPYARAITSGVDYAGPILDHTPASNYLPDPVDSAFSVPHSVVVAPGAAPTPIARRRPLSESIIYETHVKGYTLNHPMVPEHLRGTYGGLAYPAIVEHLQRIGVTAIQLLPVHHFVSEPFIIGRGLTNYWGYNTLGFFAPHAAYSSVSTLGGQVSEFRDMVTALHAADIEVILDVVYNHTGEGGHEGPTLSFRGIDHAGYYRLTPDLRNDYDVTGCGNSVDTSEPGVLAMVLDSMRYWVQEMGVDGFRFDLATTLIRGADQTVDYRHPFLEAVDTDPTFEGVKMIAEPWDMGPNGYQVGRWRAGWAEWNDRFRGHTRDVWRGAVGGVSELATRLAGSPDLFDHSGRTPQASINFITAHDGFTARDLVTYNHKHNHANGERNRDGSDDNRSWNCGVEGETDDPGVNALRHRQVRNLMATLLLAAGVPMITAGDECGRTQQGNNNAYCQDSPISWVDWTAAAGWDDVTELVATLNRLRAEHPVLRPDEFQHRDPVAGAEVPVAQTWFAESGAEMAPEQWHDGERRTVALYRSDGAEAFLIIVHSAAVGLDFRLPGAEWGAQWDAVAWTGSPEELLPGPYPADSVLPIAERSVLVLHCPR